MNDPKTGDDLITATMLWLDLTAEEWQQLSKDVQVKLVRKCEEGLEEGFCCEHQWEQHIGFITCGKCGIEL